jgi:hypothetical protein
MAVVARGREEAMRAEITENSPFKTQNVSRLYQFHKKVSHATLICYTQWAGSNVGKARRAPCARRFWYGGPERTIAGGIMQNPIIRTFIRLSNAQQARTDLLAAGFAEDNVDLQVRIDETSSVQGDFTVGDAPSVTGKTAYSHTYAPIAQEDVRDCMITVNAADPAQAEQALAILERHEGFNPDPAARAAEREDAHRRHH